MFLGFHLFSYRLHLPKNNLTASVDLLFDWKDRSLSNPPPPPVHPRAQATFSLAVRRGWVMPGIWIVVDDEISPRYAHVHNVVWTRHITDKVRWRLAGLCFNGGPLQFCRSEFNVFLFDDTEVCLRCLRLAWVYGAFAIAVRSGVKCSLEKRETFMY